MSRVLYPNLRGRPAGSKNKKPEIKKRPAHVIAVKSFLSAVACKSGLTRLEIIETTGLNFHTVQRYITAFSTGQERFIYAARYIRWNRAGQWSAVYKFGHNCANAPKPEWLTKRQKQNYLCNWIEVITDKGIYHEHTGIIISRFKLPELRRDERTIAVPESSNKPRDD